MQTVNSIIVEPLSNPQQQQQQQIHRAANRQMRMLPTPPASPAAATTATRSPAELGRGLAMILESFLEFVPLEMRQQQAMSPNVFRLFCSQAPITIGAFGERLGLYFACSPACFHAAAVYLGRVWGHQPQLFEPLSVYKLMLVALTIAVKFCEDRVSSQVHYARCGGIEVSELNTLETLFFQSLLDCKAFVHESEFHIASTTLEKYCENLYHDNSNINNESLIAKVAQENAYSVASQQQQQQQCHHQQQNDVMVVDTPAPSVACSGLRRVSHSSF